MKKIILVTGIIFFYSVCSHSQWVQISQGLPAQSTVRSMISVGSYTYAGLQYGGVYRSSNNGELCVKAGVANDSFASQIVFALCSHNGILFAGARNGCYISTDNGVT